MLKVYSAADQKDMDRIINKSMSGSWQGYMFIQPDAYKMSYPAKFVVIDEPKVKLATIQVLQ